jgi:predicted ATPase/DNA-binding CsgD family transcriptional regulator
VSATPLTDQPIALPIPRTSLVGRTGEIVSARALLLDQAVPLLTLTGPGGVGKTRLALAIARDVAPAFADGAVFVDLAPVRDPALVLSTIGQAVAIRDAGDRPLLEVLAGFLRSRRLLLLLDNFEHVLTAAPAVADLLHAAASLQVLATSRAPLRLQGEHEFPVSPLAMPAATDAPSPDLARVAAVALLLERARAVSPGLLPTDADLQTLAEICRRLDGLPLAIELAAVRLKVLSPPALLARLSDRLRILTGGPRDVPDRQRTMRDTIAWSYDLLSAEEQVLFRSLAVFVGGCTLEAAESVGATAATPPLDVLDGLTVLVDNSLLRREVGPDREPRYRMLETVREFGLEQLEQTGEDAGARSRHAACFLALAEEAAPHLLLPGQEPWLTRLAVDHDNLRAALAWLERAGDGEALLRLAGALDRFWFVRGHFGEGSGWLERALALGTDAPSALRAGALSGAGWLAVYKGDVRRAEALIGQSLALWRGLGDKEQIATNLIRLGLAYTSQERYAEAAARTEEALAVYQQIDDAVATAAPFASIALCNLGDIAQARGEEARAAGYFAEALARQRAMGFTWGAGLSLIGLGDVARVRGDTVAAASYYRESLEHWRSHRDPWGAIAALIGLADVALAWDQPERATRLLAAVAAHFEVIGRSDSPLVHQNEERARAAARATLGADRFAAAWAEGRVLSFEAAVDEAMRVGSAPSELVKTTAQASAHGLSPRELEVLRHLAQHRTDKEIAEALFVSPRTIQTHVERIRTKLGVENRREAAAEAVRLGLA